MNKSVESYTQDKSDLLKPNNGGKNSVLELWRFLAALLIMATHMYHFGIDNYYFRETWIFVEFFLIITGYYTRRHFDHNAYENKMQASLRYTWKKFKPLIPYTSVATVSAYIIYVSQAFRNRNFSRAVSAVWGGVADLLLITESYQTPLVLPLWYLSAMIMIFPLFGVLMQLKNRYWILYFSFIYPLIFYGLRGVTGGVEVPHDMFRVMAGLMLGAFAYEINVICDCSLRKISVAKLTIAEFLFLVFAAVSSCMHWPLRRLVLILFVFGLGILLSERSLSCKWNNRFADFLGRLSIPVYTMHWVVGTIINIMVENKYLNCRTEEILIYYAGTILISLLIYFTISNWRIRARMYGN